MRSNSATGPTHEVVPAEGSIRMANARFEVGIMPEVGGSICFFRTHSGDEILRNARTLNDAAASSCFAMVPFCNRLRDRAFVWEDCEQRLEPNTRDGQQAAHGFGWRAAWRVISHTSTSAHLRHCHAAGGWPWSYVAEQRMRLDDAGFAIELSVTNGSPRPMPAGLGLHPYFPLTAQTRVGIQAGAVGTVDACGFPAHDPDEEQILGAASAGRLDPRVGNRYIGGVRGDIRIEDLSHGHVTFLRDSGCSELALHVEEEHELFCLEPMSHTVGAFNANDPMKEGVRLLAPGDHMTLTVRLDVLEPEMRT